MAGAFAASLGAIAMAVVILRGVFAGEAAVDCIISSIGALVTFTGLGWPAGASMDYLVRQDIEQQYRRRVDYFRKEVEARLAEKSVPNVITKQDAK